MTSVSKTAAEWAAWGGIPDKGMVCVESDTGLEKLGDDASPWSSLPYRVNETGLKLMRAQSASQVFAALGPQRDRYGSRTVVDGDSITIGSAGSPTSRGGWTQELARLSGGRINIVANAAVASTGIDTRLANFATAVAALSPDTVILSNGTNNVASMGLAEYLTKLTQYYDQVRAIGAQLILGGIYPKNVNIATISTWNAALIKWAQPRGVLVIPFWELADPATGGWPSGWSSDGVHPLRESPAYRELGKLAWNTVRHAFTEPVALTASYQGEGLLTNFFTDLTAPITGVATITAITATTGTLAAGTYSYRVVPRGSWGKNTNYSDNTITLADVGGVSLTVTASGTYSSRDVYRKGPGDSVFKFVGQITTAGTQTFTDNGLPAQYDWFDGESSAYPVGLINGASVDRRTLAYGPPIRAGAAEGIRGNILRLARLEGSSTSHIDRFLVSGLTPGTQLSVAFKCRGADTADANERVQLYFRDAGDATTISTVPVVFYRLPSEWGLAFGTWVVPAGAAAVRVSFEGDATSPYIDIAELRVAAA